MIRFSLARPVYRPKKATNVSIYKNVWIALHARFPPLIAFFNLTDSLFPRRLLSSNFTKLSPTQSTFLIVKTKQLCHRNNDFKVKIACVNFSTSNPSTKLIIFHKFRVLKYRKPFLVVTNRIVRYLVPIQVSVSSVLGDSDTRESKTACQETNKSG